MKKKRVYFEDDDRNEGYFGDRNNLPYMPHHGSAPGNAKAIASVLIGAICLVLVWIKFFLAFLALLFITANIVGIWLAISAKRDNRAIGHSGGLASLGLALNIFSLVLFSILLIIFTALVTFILNLF